MISYLLFPFKSIRSGHAKLFSISIVFSCSHIFKSIFCCGLNSGLFVTVLHSIVLVQTLDAFFHGPSWHATVEKCLTHNPGVLGSSCFRSSGFFYLGNVLGQDTSEPRLIVVKPKNNMINVSC